MANLKFYQNERLSQLPTPTLKNGGTYQVTGVTTSSGSPNLTVGNVGVAFPGDAVTGTNIPANTIILTINSMTSITMDKNATGSGSGLTMTFTIPKHEDPDWPMSNLFSLDRSKVWRIPGAMPDPFRIDVDFGVGRTVLAHAWAANEGFNGDVWFDVLYASSYPARDPWMIGSGTPAWTSITSLASDHFETESSLEGGDDFTGRRDQIQSLAAYGAGITARYWRFEFGSHLGGATANNAASTKLRLWGSVLDIGIESGPGAEREWIEPSSELELFSGERVSYLLGRGRMRFKIPFSSVDHTVAVTNLQKKLLRYNNNLLFGLKDFDGKAYEVPVRRVSVARNFGASITTGVYDSALELESYP